MFTKADFKKGEMAALIQIGEAARRCSGSYIIEAPVTKIGRKYITVSLSWGNIQFEYYENVNRFYQKSEYSPDYELYPTRAIAEEVLKRLNDKSLLQNDVGKKYLLKKFLIAQYLCYKKVQY